MRQRNLVQGQGGLIIMVVAMQRVPPSEEVVSKNWV